MDFWIDAKFLSYENFRWNAEESAGRPAVAWLPFGSRPKACIGQRLAHLEYKLAMAKMLMRHKFVRCPETKVENWDLAQF